MKILKPRKTIAAIVAAVLVVSIVTTGTHAWQSISQQAKNETHTEINPGGRLHDDFNGTNKDVYVENFSDPNNGGVPIFARIRLDEYMEIGPDAGINLQGGTGRDVVILGTDSQGAPSNINNVASWTTHIPGPQEDPDPAVCTNGDPDQIHEYWSWDMGGSTVYMPTFNKNKDSLKADINGTLAGKNGQRYDDYVEYQYGDTLNEDAVYDNDSDDVDDADVRVYNETHTATDTLTSAVITMAEWIDLGCPVGPYWVYDDDGWAYWAQPIEPGQATGLLLDSINMDREPGDSCYYAINVVAQFATRGDWGQEDGTGFYKEADQAPSDDALFLLNLASGLKPDITITGADGAELPASVAAGSEIRFEAELTLSDRPYTDQGVVWTVTGLEPLAEGTAVQGETDEDTGEVTGVLTVSADEASGNVLIITATSVADDRAIAEIRVPVE